MVNSQQQQKKLLPSTICMAFMLCCVSVPENVYTLLIRLHQEKKQEKKIWQNM